MASVEKIHNVVAQYIELLSAREPEKIVDLFAANPTLGTIGHKGAMLDRPHLLRAQAVLARARG